MLHRMQDCCLVGEEVVSDLIPRESIALEVVGLVGVAVR